MAQIGTDILAAKAFLEAGDVVGIPTETVYGLAGNALNPNALLRIFAVKNRPAFDPLIVHTDSLEKVSQYVTHIPDAARRLAQTVWPGPLTLLLPKRDIIPDLATSGLSTVAIRVPNHPLTLALLRSLDFPLAAPSANPFGYISPTTARHVTDQLGNQIPYVLEGGPCGIGLESTIIGFDEEQPTVYRLGGMAIEELTALVGPLNVRDQSSSNPKAPGMLSSHYAPHKPVFLLQPDEQPDLVDAQTGALVFCEPLAKIPLDNQLIMSPSGDVTEAAKNLFAYLRALDALPLTRVYAQLLPNEGLGRAVNDRLKRAGAK